MSPARAVIADAGPLIALARIDRLGLLRELFAEVALCDAVAREIFDAGSFPDAARIQGALELGWLRIQALDSTLPDVAQSGLVGLGAGETASILWALHLRAEGRQPLLLIDDFGAREAARRHALDLLGVAGALALARRAGLITSLRPLLDALRAEGYFLSSTVIESALRLAQES